VFLLSNFPLFSEGVQDTSTGDGTLSRSKLNFNPGVEDVDKVLLCKAFNPVVLGSEPVSSEISLNISCKI